VSEDRKKTETDDEKNEGETPARRDDGSPKPGGPPPEADTGPEDTPFPRTPDP
jgi:hypothetical protein